MKVKISLILMLLLLFVASISLATGVTIKTYTPFADQDPAAQLYNDLMEEWATETGNVIEDYSGMQDEAFMHSLSDALKDGDVDVVILPVGSNVDTSKLVDVSTLLALAPDCGARVMNGMKEENGSVILTPVRFNWETLYVNKSVLANYGLTVPSSFEELIITSLQLGQMGIQPIANALCEWPEIVLDCTAMMGASETEYGQAASLEGAESVLNSLVLVGAFGQDPWNITDEAMEQQFISGQAAMRFDTSDLALMIPEESVDNYTVIQLPGMDGTPRSTVVGYPDIGLAMTRACFENVARQEAALSLIRKLLSAPLSSMAGGSLGESIVTLTQNATDIVGVLYDKNPETFSDWSEKTISSLMATTKAQ